MPKARRFLVVEYYKQTMLGGALKLCLLSLVPSVLGLFDNVVKPKCPPEQEICEFHFRITKRETMMTYDPVIYQNEPVYENNGSFFQRLSAYSAQCDEVLPVSQKALEESYPADGRYKMTYYINDQFPGPNVVVYEGQQVKVNVENQLMGEGITIHWHGMYQRNTGWMDGVFGVSQCAINPHETFTYRFIAEPVGTHWYHSHYGVQRSDGMFGALIVLPRPAAAPAPSIQIGNLKQEEAVDQGLPEFAEEYILLITDWFHEDSTAMMTKHLLQLLKFDAGYDALDGCLVKTLQDDGSEVGTIIFESGLFNGKGRYNKDSVLPLEEFAVEKGKSYRFRAISASMNFAFKVSIDHHKLHVISSDGNDIVPIETDYVFLHSGERFDFYLTANQDGGAFWIRGEAPEKYLQVPLEWDHPGKQSPPAGRMEAILRYADSTTEMPETSRECTADNICTVVNCPWSEYAASEHTKCINFDQIVSTEPYDLDDIPESDFEEHILSFHFPYGHGGGLIARAGVNGREFLLPSAPPAVTLTNDYSHECDDAECEEKPCQCTHEIRLKKDNVVQLVLWNPEGDITAPPGPQASVLAIPHPVHLHGHAFQIVKAGYAPIDNITGIMSAVSSDIECPTARCQSPRWKNPSWAGGNVPGMNLRNPPRKDTLMIPSGGYAVVRFKADNPGWWFMHCHVEVHQVEGMGILLQEGELEDMNPPPAGFPTCGTYDSGDAAFKDALAGKYINKTPKDTNKNTGNEVKAGTTGPQCSSQAPSIKAGLAYYLLVVATALMIMSANKI